MYTAQTFLDWKAKAATLDYGLDNIDEYYMKYQEGNINYIRDIIIERILSKNTVFLINSSINPTELEGLLTAEDTNLDTAIDDTIVIKDNKKLININYVELKKIYLFEYLNSFLKLSKKDKDVVIDSNYTLLKSRYHNKHNINELYDLYTKAFFVNRVYTITELLNNINTRLDNMIAIRQKIDAGTIKLISIDAINRIETITDLDTYFETFRNSQIDLLIDFITCK